jgi:hypothetical protein
VLFMAACGGGTDAVPTKTLWVSTDGNDSADGSEATPLRTLDGARLAVRQINTSYEGNIVVMFKGGVYRPDRTVSFDAADSGVNGHTVTYRSAKGEHAVFYGSEAVDPASWSVCGNRKGHDIYCTDISGLDPRVLESRELYVNGKRETRARTKEYPGGFMPYYDYNATDINNSGPGGILFVPPVDEFGIVDPSWPDPDTWTNVQDIEAVALPQWRMLRVPLQNVVKYPDYNNTGAFLDILYGKLFELLYAIDKKEIISILAPWSALYDMNNTGMITLQEPGWTNANLSYDIDGNETNGTYKSAIWGFNRVAWFENAYQFLDEPGEWYLNKHTRTLYYIPDANVTMATAQVELPRLERFIDVNGSSNLGFEDFIFGYATWTQPSSGIGYVTDQSGYLITDQSFEYNTIGHVQHVQGTPGNIDLKYVNNIRFSGNIFEHLGAVALGFGTGTQNCVIEDNLFEDIGSAAINLGGVGKEDYDPDAAQLTKNNTIRNNLLRHTAQAYYDAAGIFVGFSTKTLIDHNTIAYTNWAGIAMGWGWGLLDPYVNLGVDGGTPGMWGDILKNTPNAYNKITNNRTYKTLGQLWDAGGVYTTGYQGSSEDNALLIEGNVFSDKNPERGGNTVYTDGMSRFVTVRKNVMYNNPQAKVYLGEPVAPNDPFYPDYLLIPLMNSVAYGTDHGGCRTYGDISYEENYWQYTFFFDVCPFIDAQGVFYPRGLDYIGNKSVAAYQDEAQAIADKAGVTSKPDSIPAELWVLPPKTIKIDPLPGQSGYENNGS